MSIRQLEDPNIRKVVLDKIAYSRYCVKCQYYVKAYWEEKEGFKYGWIGVECCANCGCRSEQPVCPEGIGYEICLGQAIDFDPDMLWKATPELIERLKSLANLPKKKEWWDDE